MMPQFVDVVSLWPCSHMVIELIKIGAEDPQNQRTGIRLREWRHALVHHLRSIEG